MEWDEPLLCNFSTGQATHRHEPLPYSSPRRPNALVLRVSIGVSNRLSSGNTSACLQHIIKKNQNYYTVTYYMYKSLSASDFTKLSYLSTILGLGVADTGFSLMLPSGIEESISDLKEIHEGRSEPSEDRWFFEDKSMMIIHSGTPEKEYVEFI